MSRGFQGDNKDMVICDSDDQYTKCLIASNGN